MKGLEQFTNQYSLSKTLRFELKPQAETLDFIEKKGLVTQDEERKERYNRVKKIMDEYHKLFIDKVLSQYQLPDETLQRYQSLLLKNELEEKEKKELNKLAIELRKSIGKAFISFKSDEIEYKHLFGKEFIAKILPEWGKLNKEQLADVSSFNKFTTYFTGFHENRENIYSGEEKSTAVAFRIINQNLPKYLENQKIVDSILNKDEFSDFDFSALDTLNNNWQAYFDYNGFNLCLSQKGIDAYNLILGGKSLEDGTKLKGLNELIHLYRQKKSLQRRALPNLQVLYKQILSDREASSYIPMAFETDEEVISTIKIFFDSLKTHTDADGNLNTDLFDEVNTLFGNMDGLNTNEVLLPNAALSKISQNRFQQWGIIKEALESSFKVQFFEKQKKDDKFSEKIDKYLKTKFFTVAQVQAAIDAYHHESIEKHNKNIIDYFLQANDYCQQAQEGIKQISNLKLSSKGLQQDKEAVTVLKNGLDALKNLQHFIADADATKYQGDKDLAFHGAVAELLQRIGQVNLLYNKVRNYISKKPYSLEKFKLNFENGTFLKGWDKSMEAANFGVLLKKDSRFYLAVMQPGNNKTFDKLPKAKDGDNYQKIDYKQLSNLSRQIPRIVFAKSRIDFFNPSEEILRIRNTSTHTKNGIPQKGFEKLEFNLADCHKLIDFFKECLLKNESWKVYKFNFKDTNTYNDISEFYRDVELQTYILVEQPISKNYIDQLVTEGKLYLFQIYNKDFSEHSKGTPNMHTLYWRALFSAENQANKVYKLNGQAEVFYRRKSLNYTQDVLKNGHHQAALKGKFSYPIIKDRRFAFDKFQFHVPITLNFSTGGDNLSNEAVMDYLKSNKDAHIIGIDRGERHLLYVSIINQKGEIVEKGQFSLNSFTYQHKGKSIEKNYHQKLMDKESDRAQARQEWGNIESIKELKEGYLSQVIHKISELMVQYNAIVVMENLNAGFKRGRQKVERQVYQKFEKMLMDKLSYLVFKKQTEGPGSVMQALQLSRKFESFQKLGRQSGFIWYVPAALTSKIDPATGFVNLFYAKYKNLSEAQAFFGKFCSISYNGSKNQFEFKADYTNFTTRAEGSRSQYTICSNAQTRYVYNRNKANTNGRGGYEAINVNDALIELFTEQSINFNKGEELIDIICQQTKPDFFKRLIFLFNTLVSLRHSNGESGEAERDYIISPVANKKGQFFHSGEAPMQMPQNADANGAYHIALKGLWCIKEIQSGKEYRSKDFLKLDNKTWLNFAQQHVGEGV